MTGPFRTWKSLVLFFGSLYYCYFRKFIRGPVASQAHNKMYLGLPIAPVHQLVATEISTLPKRPITGPLPVYFLILLVWRIGSGAAVAAFFVGFDYSVADRDA